MSLALIAAVGVLGGAGAIGRFLVDGAVSRRAGRDLPLGILAVNVSGTFVLGVLAGLAPGGDAYLLAGGGLIGAYTTFSTWVFDSDRLRAEGRPGAAALNLAGSLVLGLAAIALGRVVGLAL